MDIDRGLIKWKPFGYAIGCIGIGINLLYFDIFDGQISHKFISILHSCIKIGLNLIYIEGFEKKTVDDYKFILLGKFYCRISSCSFFKSLCGLAILS